MLCCLQLRIYLRPEFAEFFGVGKGQGHEIHGFEVAQSAQQGVAFAKGLLAVRAAGVGHKQRGHGMPTVAGQAGGRAVVAGNDEHLGF